MRKTCWFLFTLFLIGSLLGCGNMNYSDRYPINREMQSWVNHPISELIASWGQPTQMVPSNEGSIYIWSEFTEDEPFSEKKFWVNESGTIFKWDRLGAGS